MIENCSEQLLNDVVKVDLVLSADCDLNVPVQVAVTEMSGTKTVEGETVDRIGTPVLRLAYDAGESGHGEYVEAPTYRQAQSRTMAVFVVKHDLQVKVVDGFDGVREAVRQLNGKDFNVILTTLAGARYLIYMFPNSSEVLLDEDGLNDEGSVKVSGTARSHAIHLV